MRLLVVIVLVIGFMSFSYGADVRKSYLPKQLNDISIGSTKAEVFQSFSKKPIEIASVEEYEVEHCFLPFLISYAGCAWMVDLVFYKNELYCIGLNAMFNNNKLELNNFFTVYCTSLYGQKFTKSEQHNLNGDKRILDLMNWKMEKYEITLAINSPFENDAGNHTIIIISFQSIPDQIKNVNIYKALRGKEDFQRFHKIKSELIDGSLEANKHFFP
jgi:hypothetical protein